MTDIEVLQFIKTSLSPYITRAIQMHPNTFVTEDILAGITMRETGGLIAKHAAEFPAVTDLAKHMKGDYIDRNDGKGPIAHGFGFTQIDINAFPWFVSSNAWMDPLKCFSQSIAILEGNKVHILTHNPILKDTDSLVHYSIAAYNCGAGNEDKILIQHLDPDAYTTGHNYAKCVFTYADQYKEL